MHNSPFRISIAMASYNGARFIAEQLDSFARQSRLPDELVVTDDCSNDGTPELIDEFAKRAPFPVHLHRNSKTLGVARNFGKALELCSGDLVFLSDQDDVWLVDKLACVEKHFRDNADIQVAINDAFLATASLEISQHTQRDNIRRTGGSDKLFITGCCSAHRKSWQELVLPIPPDTPHDLWINGFAIELGRCKFVPEALQLFRRHGDNSSDWFLSNPAGVSFWSAVQYQRLFDARPGWKAQAALLKAFIERLRERCVIAADHGWEASIPQMTRRIAAIEERIEICSMPRHRRPSRVFSFWTTGDYRREFGWMGAIKDLMRP